MNPIGDTYMSNKKEFRVLHIFSSYGGGISSLLLNLIENKSEEFYFDIMAFSYQNGDDFVDRIRRMGGETYRMPRPRIEGYKKFREFVDSVLATTHYDAVHCHITGCHAVPFMDAAKKHDIKCFVLHAHTTKYDSRIDRLFPVQIYDRWINYKKSVAYLTCSDLAADYIFGKKYLKRRPARLIPNGINEAVFSDTLTDEHRLTYHKEFRTSDGAFVIGHVGRFTYTKNHHFMIDIAKELKNKGMNFILVFVGDGELLDSIKKKAEDSGIDDCVHFAGRRKDIASLMQFFDCMILPSSYEGLPTVAVECQAAGTRMLLSDHITKQCDMNLDLLEFLPINDVRLWTKALERAVSTGHLDHSHCVKQIIRQGFTMEESGKQYCSILKEIIERNG